VPSAFSSSSYFLGPGDSALEIALVETPTRPSPPDIRTLWKRRQGGTPSPLLLVVLYPSGARQQAAICGPTGDPPALVRDLDPSNVERIAQAALAEPNRHAAVRFLVEVLGELESELPGLRNEGLLAIHELRTGVPTRADWFEACERGRGFLTKRGRELVESLGFTVHQRDTTTFTLRAGDDGTATAVAIFLDEKESYEGAGQRFDGNSPVSLALAKADADRLPFVVITRGSQIRLYAADKRIVGVGRRGRTDTFIEVHLALLSTESAGYLPLLFGAEALLPDGSFERVLERSRNYATDLSKRLRGRVYTDVVPGLATAIARRAGAARALTEHDLRFLYEQTLFILFRLVFIAYAEDKGLLPYATNDDYRQRALKTRAQRLADRRNAGDLAFDPNATDLWSETQQLFRAVDQGNSEWGVPAYDGGLFSANLDVSAVGAAIDRLELSNAEFGPPLSSLLVDVGEEKAFGAIDFRSLSVREFGTIYEGLLESSLSIAQGELATDRAGTYLPAKAGDEVKVLAGEVYLHNQSGARKASGSYFTKEFAVEHLLDHALEPALDDHIARLTSLVESGDDTAAADAFFDFRVADIAMGSGHFLINAVDHIEARLTSFLTEHPLPAVNGELATLRKIALERLGDAAEGTSIEQAALVRRQVARRCIYGVDVNIIAVELARLALWIHTFVPGLPLSFLDRTLVCGNSLTGIGSLDEAVEAVEGRKTVEGAMSLARDQIERYLEKAKGPLARLGRISDATPADIAEARQAQIDALDAVRPATVLFDLAVAARLVEIDPLFEVSDEVLEHHPGIRRASKLAGELAELHFPVAFPEVFLRNWPGFDCIVGNPPWEKVKAEHHRFWVLRFPGLASQPIHKMNAAIERLENERPDLADEASAEAQEANQVRAALMAGPYPGLGASDPDLYKAFAWRFWQLTRRGGYCAFVVPRTLLAGGGGTKWRQEILAHGEFSRVTILVNNRGWVFDDVHPQFTIALLCLKKGEEFSGSITLEGPFASRNALMSAVSRATLTVGVDEFRSWTPSAAFPLLESTQSADVFRCMRRQPDLSGDDSSCLVRPTYELHATKDKWLVKAQPPEDGEAWPVYKGTSFNIWQPDMGDYYGWTSADQALLELQRKRLSQAKRTTSVWALASRGQIEDPCTLPCLRPRIAFRGIARATDTRTMIPVLLPPRVVATHAAPILLMHPGGVRDEAYLLGVLASIPLDWYARRIVEANVTFEVVDSLPLPQADGNNPLRRRVETIAGRLAAIDERYVDWAAVVGVPIGSVTDPAEKADMVAELDAAVSLLYGLEEADVRHIFETFHVGWDYGARLDAVVAHYRKLKATI
jgi:hypothetical protein